MTKNTMIPVDDMLLSDYQNYTPDVGKSFLTEQKGSDSTMSVNITVRQVLPQLSVLALLA